MAERESSHSKVAGDLLLLSSWKLSRRTWRDDQFCSEIRPKLVQVKPPHIWAGVRPMLVVDFGQTFAGVGHHICETDRMWSISGRLRPTPGNTCQTLVILRSAPSKLGRAAPEHHRDKSCTYLLSNLGASVGQALGIDGTTLGQCLISRTPPGLGCRTRGGIICHVRVTYCLSAALGIFRVACISQVPVGWVRMSGSHGARRQQVGSELPHRSTASAIRSPGAGAGRPVRRSGAVADRRRARAGHPPPGARARRGPAARAALLAWARDRGRP